MQKMQFKENSRNNTSLLVKVGFIARNETVHYCILIDLVLVCFWLYTGNTHLKHASTSQKKETKRLSLHCITVSGFWEVMKCNKNCTSKTLFSDQFDYLCQQQVFFGLKCLLAIDLEHFKSTHGSKVGSYQSKDVVN